MNVSYQPRQTDVNYCWKVSKFRFDVNKDLGWATKSTDPLAINDALINGFIGALGELAVSKIFGIEWDGAMLSKDAYLVWRQTKADLGPFEVKTVSTAGGLLQIKPNDKDFAVGILMYAPESRMAGIDIINKKPPTVHAVKMMGCLPVAEAKKIGYWASGRWTVARKDLRETKTLEKLWDHFNKKRKTNTVYKCSTTPDFRLTQ